MVFPLVPCPAAFKTSRHLNSVPSYPFAGIEPGLAAICPYMGRHRTGAVAVTKFPG